ncbi:response regulator transcription factor [Thalassospira sp. TSL5-1]|uniref:response regulator transcription factor n=1 Tax=Thalassospira sp. TSL5-1 TaxID=1544451 RepID=UPI0009F89F17|nr:response regulator transcription factor [Thalassospira sp. TSL5-1]
MQTTNGTAKTLVAVVHSSLLLRTGLTSLLTHSKNTETINAPHLDDLISVTPPNRTIDVVLVSIDDFQAQITSLAAFRASNPKVRIITLAHEYDAEHLFALFNLGVNGALLDDVSQTAIELAFQLITEGEKIYPSNLASIMMERFHFMSSLELDSIDILGIDLSPREQEILECLSSGDSNKRIAIRLNISEATVKVHVKSILRKIKVDNRTQAAIWALRSQPRHHGYSAALS